ncbi:MAG: family hydrolase [Herbinix sp.]|nr:family hydrolase [Herbinix sp.]
MSTITSLQKIAYQRIARELLQVEQVRDMNRYIQHGNTSTLTHCLVVAYYSYRLALRLPIRFQYKSLIRGAILHDFYLYDWHIPDKSHKLHGFVHPRFALNNAKIYFNLTPIEEDIIAKHMWPLTIKNAPRFKEALLVSIVDKFCSLAETLYIPIVPKEVAQIQQL